MKNFKGEYKEVAELGYKIIAEYNTERGGTILARRKVMERIEFVCCETDKRENCYWGYYTNNFSDAFMKFTTRVLSDGGYDYEDLRVWSES